MRDAAVESYHEIVAERTKQKNAVHHKKGGSATSKLGNKPMSNKEIAKQHGKCEKWDLSGFMDREEFKKMRQDMQIKYINTLCDKYDVQICQISQFVLNWGGDGLRQYLWSERILDQCGYKTERGNTGLSKLREDIRAYREKERQAKIIVLSEAKRRKEIIQNAEFITYEEFASWNPNDRLAYVNALIEHYHVSMGAVGSILFEKSKWMIRENLRPHGLNEKVLKVGKRGPIATTINQEFQDAVDAWKGRPVKAVTETEPEVKPAAESEPEQPQPEIIKELPEVPAEEAKEPEKPEGPEEYEGEIFRAEVGSEPEQDPRIYHDMSFRSEYVRVGLDEDEIDIIKKLVAGKLVRVRFEITVI